MKTILAILTLLSINAVAGTEVFRCNAEFVAPDDNDQLQIYTATMVINSDNGKETAEVTMDGNLIYSGNEVEREISEKPEIDMVQGIKDYANENPEFAKLAKQVYGNKVEDVLNNTVHSEIAGFFTDDGGALLVQHFDANKKLIATEMDLAWAGPGFCK